MSSIESMEITQHPREGRLELQLKGRLDANWSDHVGNTIESAIRAGNHNIELDLAQVDYVSSAGIRMLVKHFKRLKTARGTLRIVRTTDAVLSVLQLSGLDAMLVAPQANVAEAVEKTTEPQKVEKAVEVEPRRWELKGVVFESYDQQAGAVLDCKLHGQPEQFATGQLSAEQSIRVRFDSDLFGLGLGAFGSGGRDAQGRFGEILGVGGTAVAQPTDGSSMADFQISESQFVPEVNLLYGLTARGRFARLLRFEAGQSERRVIALSDLIEAALKNLETISAGFVILAESACVVGASLRQSPALAAGKSPWNFPGVRDWLSFTTERADERNVILVVGFAEREPAADRAPFLRRIGPGTLAQGHFHAAVFPYRPLPKGNVNLQESVFNLLSTESAQTVLHLLADEREFEGVGQTDLMRGACWIAPLKSSEPAPGTRPTP
jgi:anti-anti-sigma factor